MRRNLHLNKVLSVIFVMSITLIYFRILPSDVETQPIAILSFLFLISLSHISNFRYLSSDEFFAAILLIIILVFGMVSFFFNGVFGILECVKLSLGPLFYIFFRRVNLNIKNDFFLFFGAIFFFYLLMTLIVGKEQFNSIGILGIRAVDRYTFFMAEPSYLSPLITILLYFSMTRLEKGLFKSIFMILLIFVVFISGSVFNILFFLFIVMSFLMVRYGVFSFLFFSIIGLFFISLVLFSIYNGLLDGVVGLRISRLSKALVLVFTGQIDISSFFYQYEPSGSTRLILNYLAFSTPFTKDFWGVFPGGFSREWLNIAQTLGVDVLNHPVLGESTSPSAQTYFANLVSSVGFFALPYIFILLSNNKNDKDFKSRVGQVFLYFSIFFFSFFQLQITNPALWFLISLCKKDIYGCQR